MSGFLTITPIRELYHARLRGTHGRNMGGNERKEWSGTEAPRYEIVTTSPAMLVARLLQVAGLRVGVGSMGLGWRGDLRRWCGSGRSSETVSGGEDGGVAALSARRVCGGGAEERSCLLEVALHGKPKH